MTTEEQDAVGTVYDTVRDEDDNIVSSTATTTDADGNVVSVVERTFDTEGNVTSATYTDHTTDADTGDTTTEVTEYEHGVITEESSTTTNSDGVVVESNVTTFDGDGDRDTNELRLFDPGGAPLESHVTLYDDDGDPIMTTIQLETGRSGVSYAPGVHTRTTTDDDGTVTRETFRVDANGTPTSKVGQVADASGEVQSSSETYYDDDGEPETTNEFDYVDGQATKQTTTTVDDEGTHVSERTLDDELQPTSEVRTSYDDEGNVTGTTYLEYDDGKVTYEGDEPPRAEFLEQLAEHTDIPDLTMPATSLDASDVLSQQLDDGPAVAFDGDGFAGAVVADDVASIADAADADAPSSAADAPEVLWTKSDDAVGGVERALTGYADGSVLISTSATSVFGVEAGPRSEHVFPDGTRVVTKPIDKATTEGLGLDVGSLATFEEMWAGAGDVTLTYGADGALTGAEWFTPQGNGGVGGEIVVAADGSLTTKVQTFDHGDVVDTRVETSPLPTEGSAGVDPAAPFRNPDGSIVQTTTFDSGDVAIEHKIVEADGSIRSITHFNDGSVALANEAGDIERIFGDGTTELSGGAPIEFDADTLVAVRDDGKAAVENLTPEDLTAGAGADETTVDADAFAKLEHFATELDDVPGESEVPGGDTFDGESGAPSSFGPGRASNYGIEDRFEADGEPKLPGDQLDDGAEVIGETEKNLVQSGTDPSLEPNLGLWDQPGTDPSLEPNLGLWDQPETDPSLDPNLGLWDQPETDPSLDPNLGLWDQPEADPSLDPNLGLWDQPEADPSLAPNLGLWDQADDASSEIPDSAGESNVTAEPVGGDDYPQTDVFSTAPDTGTLPDPFAPDLGEAVPVAEQPQFVDPPAEVAALAEVGDDAQLADPFAPVSEVAEEVKVTYAEPEDAGAKEPIAFDDPLAAPAAAASAAELSPADDAVIEPVAAVIEPEVELPAVQMEPTADLTDVDVTSIADAPTFEEPLDHAVTREALDLGGPELDLDGLPDADQLDGGVSG